MKDLHGHRSFQALRLLVLSLCVYLAMAACREYSDREATKYTELVQTLRNYFGLESTLCHAQKFDSCFCSADTESCGIFYRHVLQPSNTQLVKYYLQVDDVKSTKLEPSSQPAGAHAFVCREPGDEDVLLCERWKNHIPSCAYSLTLCHHRWEFDSCRPNQIISLCKLKCNKNSPINKSEIETCRYGFQAPDPLSGSSPRSVMEPLTTTETEIITEGERPEGAEMDNIPGAVWILLCCIFVFIALVFLALFLFQRQKMRRQREDVLASKLDESIVIVNTVYGSSVNSPPSGAGAHLGVYEIVNEGDLVQVEKSS